MLEQMREKLIAKLLPEVCHKNPILSGLPARISSLALVRQLVDGVAEERIARLRNGFRVRVNLKDFNGRMLFLFGTPDPKIIAVCKALLRKGDGFVDVGANHGAVGLLCAGAVGPNGAVHMFEPQPDLCERIRECIEESRLTWVRLHEVGLMDRDGVLPFQIPINHSGMGSYVIPDITGERVSLPVRDVSSILPSLIGQKPFGVKLDVEGAEMAILPQLVAMPGLRFVVCECTTRYLDIWSVLRDAGLEVFGIRRTVFLVRVRRVQNPADLQKCKDLLAVRLKRRGALTGDVHPSEVAVQCEMPQRMSSG